MHITDIFVSFYSHHLIHVDDLKGPKLVNTKHKSSNTVSYMICTESNKNNTFQEQLST